jgi:uncharacterized protein with FMN-binding domain
MTVPRKTVTTLAAAWMLAFPALNAWAAATGGVQTKPKKKVVTSTQTVTGPSVQCKRWGQLVIRIKVQKTVTTIGTAKSTKVKILSIDYPVYPKATFRSVYINDQALPLLIEEALETQNANVETISGATDVTVSFKASLQAAILQAKK